MTLIVHNWSAWYYLDVTSHGIYLVTVCTHGRYRDRYETIEAARDAAFSYASY